MFNRKLAASMLALTLIGGTSVRAMDAYASPAQPSPPAPVSNASAISSDATADPFKVSREGYHAMRRANGAEIALLNGDKAAAAKLIEEAKTSLKGASRDAVPLNVDGSPVAQSQQAAQGQIHVLPVAVQFGLSEEFINDPANKDKLAKAKAHVKAGNPRAAVETLELAGVDYQTVFAMIPFEPTQHFLDLAGERVLANDTEGALKALKTIRDSVAVASVDMSMVAQPSAAAAGSGATHPPGAASAAPPDQAAAQPPASTTPQPQVTANEPVPMVPPANAPSPAAPAG